MIEIKARSRFARVHSEQPKALRLEVCTWDYNPRVPQRKPLDVGRALAQILE